MEDGAPFTAVRDFQIELVIPAGELKEATMGAYRHEGLLIDVTYAKPQAVTHLQRGNATFEASKSAHYARPGYASFDQRFFKLTNDPSGRSFGFLGQNGEELLKQVGTNVVRGEGGVKTTKGVFMGRIS